MAIGAEAGSGASPLPSPRGSKSPLPSPEAAREDGAKEEQPQEEQPRALSDAEEALRGPLRIALERAGVKEVLALVQRGAPLFARYDLDELGDDTGTALDYALLHKRYELAHQLLLYQTQARQLATASKRAVAWTARDGKLKLLELLLELGAKPEQTDVEARSALLLACMRGQGAAARALLAAGAAQFDLHLEDIRQWVAHWKLQEAFGAHGRYLIQATATDGDADPIGWDPGDADGAAEPALDVTRFVEPTRDWEGQRVRLQVAIMRQGAKDVKALVAEGVPLTALYDLDDCGKDTGTALDLAMLHRRYDMALQFLTAQEFYKARGLACSSTRAVAWAARDGRLQILQELLRLGAEAIQRDEQGQSALYLAALRGHGQCVQLLLNAGALTEEPRAEEVEANMRKWKMELQMP